MTFPLDAGLHNFDADEINFVAANVSIKDRTVCVVGDENVQVPIFFVVEDENASPVENISDTQFLANFLKSNLAVIVLKIHILIQTGSGVMKKICVRHLWIIEAIRVDEIQVAIVVEVKEGCAPSPVPIANSDRVSLVREFTTSFVPMNRKYRINIKGRKERMLSFLT